MTIANPVESVDPDRRRATVRDLDRQAEQLAAVPISRWRVVDQQVRGPFGHIGRDSSMWHDVGVSADQVSGYAALVGDPTHAVAILAMQSDGYVREAAIRFARQHRLPSLIPLALLRASDWVSQVRAEAERALDEVRAAGEFERFIPSLGLMRSEPGSPRARYEYVAALRAEVIERVSAPALIDALRSPDTRGRHEAARALIEIGRADDAFGVAVSGRDPVIANIIAGGVSDAFWTVRSNVDVALRSRFAPVQVTGLFYLQRLDHTAAVEEATHNLTNSRASMRRAAQRLLASDGTDVAAIYRTLIGDDSRWAVAGLGETGDASDVDLLIDPMGSDDELLRAAALAAAARLDGRRVEQLLVAAVGDASLVVALAAARALAQLRPTRTSIDELWDIAAMGRYAHTRRAAFKVFAVLGRWERLVVSMRAIATHTPELFHAGDRLLRGCLQNWNRSSIAPPAAALNELVVLVPASFGWVDMKMIDLLLTSLRPYLADQVEAWSDELEDLRATLRDAHSHNDARELASVSTLSSRIGEPVADDAIVEVLTQRPVGVEPDFAPIRSAADVVLGVDSSASRRLFARTWHHFETHPTWPIGSTLTDALTAGPPGNRDPANWAELTDDHDPTVVAGASSILALLDTLGPGHAQPGATSA